MSAHFDDIAAVEALIEVAIEADWQYHEADVSLDADSLWGPLERLLNELRGRRLADRSAS